jgi:type I restriction enzyme S subunit
MRDEGEMMSAESGKRFKPYPTYKDSGVEWLGEIPAHWAVRRLKTIASVELSNVDKKSVEGQVSVRLCNYIDVYYNERITNAIEFMSATATPHQRKRFELQVGDVLITKDSESWTDIAVPSVVAEELQSVVCGYHLALIRPSAALLDGRFLARAFSAIGPRDQFQISANGITRFGLSGDAVRTGLFAVPTLAEQRAIAEFLDRETEKIDALVAKKEQLIELLQEKRTALITRAVTKGLDLSVVLEDSGIASLGGIPSHWSCRRLKYACEQIFLGLTSWVDYVDHGGFPLVRALNIADGVLNLTDARRISESQHRQLTKYRRANRDDILLSKSGSIGVAALVDTDNEFSIYESIFVLRPRRGLLIPRYLLYALRSIALQEQYRMNMVGMGVDHLNMSDIEMISVPMPPLGDQERIVRFLDAEIGRIDALVSKIRDGVNALMELRTAVISAAVTGKIDVREEVA